jgi:xanthine dehydrogenase molybdopterin-binding subunit B
VSTHIVCMVTYFAEIQVCHIGRKQAAGGVIACLRLQEDARFEERVKEVRTFNAGNAWRKRGIAITPVRWGLPDPAAS